MAKKRRRRRGEQPEPYWWEERQCYYVQIGRKHGKGGKLVKLDPDKEIAWKLYHELMADEQKCLAARQRETVAWLFETFLEAVQHDIAPRTYEEYVKVLSSFQEFIGLKKKIGDVTVHDATRWLNQAYPKAGNSDTTRNRVVRGLKRPFNWGEKQGLVQLNPLKGLELPKAKSRDVYYTPQQWEKLVASVEQHGELELLDFIKVMKLTGCRPQELRAVEARHFSRPDECLVLQPGDETIDGENAVKGEEDRVINLEGEALTIVERLVLRFPEGKLFRNRRGNPWTRTALNHACDRYTKRLGFRVIPYGIRHTFATDAILEGVDLITIATLMGHKDLTMLQRIYQHINRRADHLKDALAKINRRQRRKPEQGEDAA